MGRWLQRGVHLGSLSPGGLSHGHLPPAHRYGSDAAAVMLWPWQPKDTAEMRFVGKGGSSWFNVCGEKKSQTSLQVGEQSPSPPWLCHLSQATSSADEGCSSPSDWRGWHLHFVPHTPLPALIQSRTALFEHIACQPLPLQTAPDGQMKLSLWGRTAGLYSRKPPAEQGTGLKPAGGPGAQGFPLITSPGAWTGP